MKVDIITIFPRLVDAGFGEGIVRRAVERGLVDARVWDLREFTDDRHRSVDDVAFGGGPGMVLKPAPIFGAVERIRRERGDPPAIILTSPQGRRFTQPEAERLSRLSHLVFICGRYEGVDERVREHLATEELSIGDYVLTGGELAALVVCDAVIRLLPGAVGDERSVEADSFARGLLDYGQYTRPADFRGLKVPEVLLSGHHGAIRQWRRREAIRRTLERRPELLGSASLDAEEQELLRDLMEERKGANHGDKRD
ncbi:MAG: tRNA (guanosine(37)-N1)-methyltransferase TrmD [Acidobacteria bacterium]|nr:tRNA (guanosine(37)-N1)-methyltransferase TrmD [Acidobacteriota bacterium]